MGELLFGAETEYAVAAQGRGRMPDDGVAAALLQGARGRLAHVSDLSSRGGLFLSNGARLYVDRGSHPEYCTPECASPWDLIKHVEAGHRILSELTLKGSPSGTRLKKLLCFRSNVDYGGTFSCWGAHESYLYRGSSAAQAAQLISHLVTRPIYTGAGGFCPQSSGLMFTLSPRLLYFEHQFSGDSIGGRAIWDEKREPLSAKFKRLHVICGESVCSQTALFLKFGVTALIVAMADAGLKPGAAVKLANPVAALRTVTGDTACQAPLAATGKRSLTAIRVQRHYLEFAESHLADSFMPSWAGDVCGLWRSILDRLEAGPDAVARTLDWAIKRVIYMDEARRLGLQWEPFRTPDSLAVVDEPANFDDSELEDAHASSQWSWADGCDPQSSPSSGLHPSDLNAGNCNRSRMFEIDTRFGQLGAGGIFEMLDGAGVLEHRLVDGSAVECATTEPPEGSRARIRGEVIRRLAGNPEARCDWEQIIDPQKRRELDLSDPFAASESWRALRVDVFHGRTGTPSPWQRSLARRERAYDLYIAGDYGGAERQLRICVRQAFEVCSTRCHLARVLILLDREPEARAQIAIAWEALDHAPCYVRLRILFFRCLFAILDGQNPSDSIALIRNALDVGGAHFVWTIRPVLDHLHGRLAPADFRFLECLGDALSYSSAMSRLSRFPQWRDAASPPVESQ